MMPKKITPEIDAMLNAEAIVRAGTRDRTRYTLNKTIAHQSGLAVGYVANLIARKRRAIEARINVSCETSTSTNVNVNA
jgi:hypothetical protein